MSSTTSDLDKQLEEIIIKSVVDDLIKQKQGLTAGKRIAKKDKNTNTNPYEVALKHLAKRGINNINAAALHKRVSRALKKQKSSTVDELVIVASPATHVSSLSSPSFDGTQNPTEVQDAQSNISAPSSYKGGRPKGSTNAKKRLDATNLAKCVDMISFLYDSKRKNRKADGFEKVVDGLLEALIDEQKKDFGVADEIKPDRIRR